MPAALLTALLSGISIAALRIITKLASAIVIEQLMSRLLIAGSKQLAKKTGNSDILELSMIIDRALNEQKTAEENKQVK